MMETEEVNEPEATILEKEREVKRKTPKVTIRYPNWVFG